MTTDTDPRQPSARAFHIAADGTVDGMELHIIKIGNPKYVVKSVAVLPEREAGQNQSAKIFVTDAQGLPIVGARVNLLWPWSGSDTQINFERSQAPGNADYPIDHIIASIFDPYDSRPGASRKGPLAVAPVDAAGKIIGDIVAGFGMPGEISPDGTPKGGRHMCFQVLYVAAAPPGVQTDPDPDEPDPTPDPDPDEPDDEEPGDGSAGALARIANALERLVKHFGA